MPLLTGFVPAAFKQAVVQPVIKRNSNCRSVSELDSWRVIEGGAVKGSLPVLGLKCDVPIK